ncbi:MAG: ABC transporter permease subunit [Angelakisella sp.]
MSAKATEIKSDITATKKKLSLPQRIKKALIKDWHLYLLCLPAMIFVIIFEYGPMYGLQIAFKDYSAAAGIWGSKWVGFKHFIRFFNAPQFWDMLKNTLSISVYSLLAGFPIPIFIGLLLNQTRNLKFKKLVQTVIYAPHFISVVVLCGMLTVFLSPSTGIINNVMSAMGMERMHFLAEPALFNDIFVWSDIWQNTGWSTIIYIGALSSISPELYEAAKIDGASKLKTILHIDIPSILPTIVVLFIMRTGKFMNLGFQKAFLLQNPLNSEASEIIATYIYKVGIFGAQFSYSTAVGLFNAVINVALIMSVNAMCKKLNDTSLW